MAIQLIVKAQGTGTSSGALNVFCTHNANQSDLSAGLKTFYTSIAGLLGFGVNFSMDPTYREFDPATGGTISQGTMTGADLWTVAGTGTSNMLPDQTALLVKWRTGVWTNGRQVTGRTYIPYGTTANGSGSLVNSSITTLTNAANALAGSATAGLRVWTRVNGATHLVTSGAAWNEYAVQRSRRN